MKKRLIERVITFPICLHMVDLDYCGKALLYINLGTNSVLMCQYEPIRFTTDVTLLSFMTFVKHVRGIFIKDLKFEVSHTGNDAILLNSELLFFMNSTFEYSLIPEDARLKFIAVSVKKMVFERVAARIDAGEIPNAAKLGEIVMESLALYNRSPQEFMGGIVPFTAQLQWQTAVDFQDLDYIYLEVLRKNEYI